MKKSRENEEISCEGKVEEEEYDPKRRLVLYAPESIRELLTTLGQGQEEELTPNMMALEIVSEVLAKKIPLEVLANNKEVFNC